MKKQYWVKPKMTMTGFNKGNLYDFKQTADPKVIEVTKEETKEETKTEAYSMPEKAPADFINFIPAELIMIDQFQQTWLEWIKYKKEIRNKVTESTAKKQLIFLQMHKENAIDIINQSIQSGWKGLFELKNNYHQNGTVKPRRNTLQDF